MEAPGFTLLIILMQNLTINMLFDAEIPWAIWAPVTAAATPEEQCANQEVRPEALGMC